jgi:ABC-type glycerol-3-phosphate transport system substrate-binding protein
MQVEYQSNRLRVLGAVLGLLLICAGCAPAQPGATGEAQPAMPVAQPAGMRPLSGQLTIAVQGALPVEGAPETAAQVAWRAVLEKYKQYQPNVEVVIEDLPAGQTGEQWCEAKKVAQQMPDVTYVGECNYFRPSPEEIAQGLNIAVDFKEFEEEINPYSGKPWKDDWFNDSVRLARCTERGAVDLWTCQTTGYSGAGIWVNWDILKEFGYDHTFPASYTELWELSAQINESGKYVAWDGPPYASYWFAWIMYTNLTINRWLELGGDLNDLQGSVALLGKQPDYTLNWCNQNFWSSVNPDIQEALHQWKRLIEAYPGGGAAYWDPARDQNGTLWLNGQAAMSYHGTWFYGAILQAQNDATFLVEDFGVERFPNLQAADLINPAMEIAFNGEPFMWAGGFGDVFAPSPTVRASGNDPNVDLLVRDWFQFMSAEGMGIVNLATGTIPLNPATVEQADPALKGWLTIKPDQFVGVSQPPGSYSNPIIYTEDTEKNIQAWSADQVDFQTATQKADENATRSLVKKLEDSMADLGINELPADCLPFASQ